MKKYGHLVMEIVGGCNAKCKYCTTGIANRKNGVHIECIDPESFKKGIDYVLEHGFFDRENGQLELFSWGEPFLNKRLNDILRIVCERKIRYRLSTNASVFQRIDAQNLPFLDDLCISISGFTQESYGRIHGLDLNRVLENVRTMAAWLRECGYENKMVMNFHVYQFNIDEVAAAHRFCRENGIRFIPHVAYLADFELFNSYMLGEMDDVTYREVSKELLLGTVEGLMRNYKPGYVCKQYDALILDERLRILPCCFATSEEALGNLFDFGSVEELESVRKNIELCVKCRKSNVCFVVNQDKYFPYYEAGDEEEKPILPHVYFDAGDGYSETQTLYDREGRVSHSAVECAFDIPKETRALRFDPIEGRGCLIRSLICTDESGRRLEVQPANGERLGGGEFLFRTDDPQILIRYDRLPKRVRVRLEWALLSAR